MGALPEQPTEFTFSDGIHEGDDSWLQTAGFARLENCVQDRDGSIIKQVGTVEFTTTTVNRSDFTAVPYGNAAAGGAAKLVKRGNMLGAIASGRLYAKTDKMVQQCSVSPWVADLRTVVEVDGAIKCDCCQSGDWIYTCFTFNEPAVGGNRVRVAVTYAPTGETVAVSSSIGFAAATSVPRVVPWNTANGTALLVWLEATTLMYCQLAQESFTAPAAFSAAGATSIYDIATDTVGAFAYLTYYSTTNFINVQKFTLGATTVASSAGPFARAAVNNDLTSLCLALNPAATGSWLIAFSYWVAGVNQRVAAVILNTNFGGGTFAAITLVAETAIWNGAVIGAVPVPAANSSVNRIGAVGISPGGDWYITFHDRNYATAGGEFAYDLPTQRGARFSSAGSVGTLHFCGLLGMRSRPWFQGSNVYFLASSTTGPGTGDTSNYHAILGIEANTAGLTRYRPFGYFGLAQAEQGDQFRLMTPFVDRDGFYRVQWLENDPGVLRTRIREARLAVDDRLGIFGEFGDQTYFTGALLWAWDGVCAMEAGFLQDPYITGITTAAGSLAAGTRYYKVTYSRTSHTGELLRSKPSASVASTNAAAFDNIVTALPLMISAANGNNPSPTYLEVWRTKAGETTPFYLASRRLLDPQSRVAVAFTDAISDANLFATYQTALYTDGAENTEIANDPPCSATHLAVWRNRLWITDGEQINYTKEGALQRAAEFSSAFTIQRATPERLTALGALGDVLACFGADYTGYVYGEGPAGNGQGSSLTGPVLIEGAKGCIQPAGLLEIRTGLLVRTRLGIESLSLKREWSWVGQAIQDTLEDSPRVRDCTVELGKDRAWFALSDAAGLFGTKLMVLDLQKGTWGTLFAARSACSVRGTALELAWAQAGLATGLMVVTPTVWRDDGSDMPQLVETPWFKPSGLMGEIRIRKLWLLAERFKVGGNSSGLKVEVAYNFASTYTHLATLTSTQLAAMEDQADAVKLRLSFARQRCTSFRLRFTEVPGGADLPGFRFVACRFVVAARRVKGALLSSANAGNGLA